MTVSNNRSALRWRSVALASLLNGLFVLLTLAAAGCGSAEPNDAVDTVVPVATPTLVPTLANVAPTEQTKLSGDGTWILESLDGRPISGSAEPNDAVAPVVPVATPTLVPTLANVAPPEQTELSGDGTWILESLDGRPIIDETFVRIEIREDQFSGYDGCNWISGYSEDDLRAPATFEKGVLSLPHQFATTARLCDEHSGVMEQAELFTAALTAGETYRAAGERLEIIDGDGDVRLVFVKQLPLEGQAIDLVGTAWRLVPQDIDANGDGNAATLAFLDDRLVIGSTACRSYLATYSRSEEGLRFPSQSMLERSVWESCSDEERRLEGEFGDFLSSANEYAIKEERGSVRLRMRSTTGKALTFEQLPPIVEDVADAEWILLALTELQQLEFGMWHHKTSKASGEAELTLSFNGDSISGSTGCNSYGAEAEVGDGDFTINAGTLFYTELGCHDMDGVMEQEQRYLDTLPNVTRFGLYGNHLVLQTNEDEFLLFRAK